MRSLSIERFEIHHECSYLSKLLCDYTDTLSYFRFYHFIKCHCHDDQVLAMLKHGGG